MAMTNVQTALPVDHEPAPRRDSALRLSEEELVRSLAEVLYIEQSDIDAEKPFGEMGLDSVVGVVRDVDGARGVNREVEEATKLPGTGTRAAPREDAGGGLG